MERMKREVRELGFQGHTVEEKQKKSPRLSPVHTSHKLQPTLSQATTICQFIFKNINTCLF